MCQHLLTIPYSVVSPDNPQCPSYLSWCLFHLFPISFNHPPEGLNKYEVCDLIDFIIIIKHVLYRLKYRERIERVPSSRLILTITCMELEKALLARNFLGQRATLFSSFSNALKEHVGF